MKRRRYSVVLWLSGMPIFLVLCYVCCEPLYETMLANLMNDTSAQAATCKTMAFAA